MVALAERTKAFAAAMSRGGAEHGVDEVSVPVDRA
jgi:hypothetical protein